MTEIRRATEQDVDALAEMGCAFLAASPYGVAGKATKGGLRFAVCCALRDGVIFVAESERGIVGAIVGSLSTTWFNPTLRIAVELAWWMDPEHRGSPSAIRLLREFESWAVEMGAGVLVLSDLIAPDLPPTEEMFGKLGYKMVERSFVKEVA